MHILRRFSLILFLLPVIALSAQTPFPAPGQVFRDDVVPRIDILLHPDSLAQILALGNELSDYHYHATFIFDNGSIRDTVENIGFRLRGNTSRFAAKKSFKVSFNTYEQGRKWRDLEKLNINGEHNDPTISRSKVSWDMLRDMKVPAPRANHVELYINGANFGLYANVEHIDEQFAGLRFGNKRGNLYKCLWPADLVYLGGDPDLYKLTSGDRRVYELTINEEVDDYSDLAHFIGVLNNTPIGQLPCELEQVFHVDAFLRALAFDILSGNWDGPLYNKNNFYLYHNEATGLFELIPYDLDNTFGIDWLGQDWGSRNIYSWGHPGEPRPLYWRIMQIPQYRDRFSYYIHRFVQEIYREDILFPYINSIRDRISPYAAADPKRPLDYGFTFENFLQGFEESLPWFHTDYGLKEFITVRRNATLDQLELELNDIQPIVRDVAHNHPTAAQDISITCEVEDDGDVQSVEVCYQFGGPGGITCMNMSDDGLNLDGSAGDGIFGVIIPALNVQGVFEYFIRATDDAGQESRYPVCGFREIFIGSAALPLAVNEFMASNSTTIADEAGQYDDWVEIVNYGQEPIFLGGRYLSDNEDNPDKWAFPDIWIQPNEFLLIWADDDEGQGELHANFKLDAEGEFIGVFDVESTGFALIDGLAFGPQQTDRAWGRLPNGTGPFQAVHPTPGASNEPLSSTPWVENRSISWSVFPNPFAGELTVRFHDPNFQAGRITLSDALGRQRFELVNPGREIRFFTAGLPPGIYFVVVEMADGARSTEKVIHVE
jgi:hypothetical protein